MRAGLVAVLLAAACGRGAIDVEAMRDPASCEGCHAGHVREWASSMHAYASDDPVFLALERLGQRETGGALGDFCVRCHAPTAVAIGAIVDGEGLEALPRSLRGVGCVACHQIDAVTALHNGGLEWAEDGVVRGGLRDAVETPAHGSAYSALLDTADLRSSDACGACHDVVAGELGVEQTYAEWAESAFAKPPIGLSCGACHMPGRDGEAAEGERPRRVHDHRMPGVDLALTDWPDRDVQRALVERDLASVLTAKLCTRPAGAGVDVDVTLDNVGAGHAFPSGVTHARRAWVELVAEEGGAVTHTSGAYDADDVVPIDGDDWVLGSRFLDADGAPVAHVWDAAAIEGELLPTAPTFDPSDPASYHAVTRTFFVPGAPDTIRMRVRIQPVARDVLDDLVAAGELDPTILDAMPILDLAPTALTWRATDGWGCSP